MGNIFLGITIILYIIAAFLFVFIVVRKHQTYEGYDVGWNSFRLKIRNWFIGSSILGGIFQYLIHIYNIMNGGAIIEQLLLVEWSDTCEVDAYSAPGERISMAKNSF